MKCIVGVDEVGRGPIAGPVSVGVVVVSSRSVLRKFSNVRDSKQLSSKQRQEWYERIQKTKRSGLLDYYVSHTSPSRIDTIGITQSIRVTLARCLKRLRVPTVSSKIYLDGGLYAPKTFLRQTTIIKGDEIEPIIALASIVAKVERDKRMTHYYARMYPNYGFEFHKGYGTKEHYIRLERHGLSPIHRTSFIHLPKHI